MKQVSYIISTYTSDVSGVCSALYELGGMVVIHDPSGCNSTYNTHDEPRWFDQDSLIFISGLSHMDAIMGDDDKFIEDILRAAREHQPRFIALVRSPVPLMIGTDFEGIAREIESRCAIPTFFVPTTGMKSYTQGAGEAFRQIVERMMPLPDRTSDIQWNPGEDGKLRVNILGATPLDFSVNESYHDLRRFLTDRGFQIQGSLSLESDFEEFENLHRAHVNLVVTSLGYEAALLMEERYGIPYVVGFPCGRVGERIAADLRRAFQERRNIFSNQEMDRQSPATEESFGILVHEPIIAQSLALMLKDQYDLELRPVSMLDIKEPLKTDSMIRVESEEEMQRVFEKAAFVIADPMYRPICPNEIPFLPLAHEAFSGRTYRRMIPNPVLKGKNNSH